MRQMGFNTLMGIKPGTIGPLEPGGTGPHIGTQTVIKDEKTTFVVDIKDLSPRESIDFITCLKEYQDVKFIKEPGNGI